MKHIIFTTLLTALCFSVQAQSSCAPDTSIHHSGISKLPDGVANIPYNETIQFRFPSDSVYMGFNVHIDSVKIYAVTNMPYGYSYACNKKSRTYKGDENGCVVITGNPVDSQIRSYTFNILDSVWAVIAGSPTIIAQPGPVKYAINANSGIFYQSVTSNLSVQNYPNPFDIETEIRYFSPDETSGYFKISNTLGQQVYFERLNIHSGQNTLTFERNGLPAGIYHYSISTGKNLTTRTMVIKD